MRRCWQTPLLLLGFSTACESGPPAAPLSDSAFVRVMADLRRLRDTTGIRTDSAMRAEVFRRHRVSVADVDATARIIADDPDRSSNIWHAIDRRALALQDGGAR